MDYGAGSRQRIIETQCRLKGGAISRSPVPGLELRATFKRTLRRFIPIPSWREESLRDISAAWYQREITIPGEWAGRRIAVSAEYLNSYAVVFVDGKQAGEIRYPGGEVDLTRMCRAGSKYLLSMLVVAMPLKAVMRSYNDTASVKEIKGSVARRGLCGDVYLVSVPSGPRIIDVKVDTSVRKGEITFEAALQGLDGDGQHIVRVRVFDTKGQSVREFNSEPFRVSSLKNGRISFTKKWNPDNLWDIHTPAKHLPPPTFPVGCGR